VFVFEGNELQLRSVLTGIGRLIEPKADDVRAYHLPNECEVAMLGIQEWPEGIFLGAKGIDRLLHELTRNPPSPIVDPAKMRDRCFDDGYLDDNADFWQSSP
jgi:hypothetical protein